MSNLYLVYWECRGYLGTFKCSISACYFMCPKCSNTLDYLKSLGLSPMLIVVVKIRSVMELMMNIGKILYCTGCPKISASLTRWYLQLWGSCLYSLKHLRKHTDESFFQLNMRSNRPPPCRITKPKQVWMFLKTLLGSLLSVLEVTSDIWSWVLQSLYGAHETPLILRSPRTRIHKWSKLASVQGMKLVCPSNPSAWKLHVQILPACWQRALVHRSAEISSIEGNSEDVGTQNSKASFVEPPDHRHIRKKVRPNDLTFRYNTPPQ